MPYTLNTHNDWSPCHVIQRARQVKGLTQRELSQRVGVSPSTLSQVENGRRALDPALAARLAVELDLQGQRLQRLLGSSNPRYWRRWIWQSRCTPNEKLLLLALLERTTQMAETAALVTQTGLPPGTVAALTEALQRQGVLKPVLDAHSDAVLWRFAGLDEVA